MQELIFLITRTPHVIYCKFSVLWNFYGYLFIIINDTLVRFEIELFIRCCFRFVYMKYFGFYQTSMLCILQIASSIVKIA